MGDKNYPSDRFSDRAYLSLKQRWNLPTALAPRTEKNR